jgi:hypothetical protein
MNLLKISGDALCYYNKLMMAGQYPIESTFSYQDVKTRSALSKKPVHLIIPIVGIFNRESIPLVNTPYAQITANVIISRINDITIDEMNSNGDLSNVQVRNVKIIAKEIFATSELRSRAIKNETANIIRDFYELEHFVNTDTNTQTIRVDISRFSFTCDFLIISVISKKNIEKKNYYDGFEPINSIELEANSHKTMFTRDVIRNCIPQEHNFELPFNEVAVIPFTQNIRSLYSSGTIAFHRFDSCYLNINLEKNTTDDTGNGKEKEKYVKIIGCFRNGLNTVVGGIRKVFST